MVQDNSSKEEVGELLDQRFHILASTQELRHSTGIFVKLSGDFLGEESPIFLLMGMWLRHIDHFKRKYDKVFANNPLFGAEFMDCIHKLVQVFLPSFNTSTIEDMESVSLTDFWGLYKKVEKGYWFTSTPG